MRLEQEVNIYGDAEILKRFQAAETSISVVQGNISALISESEIIELQNSHTTMYSQMASLKLSVSDLILDFSDLQTKYNTVTGQYTDLSSRVAQYKASVDGLSADIAAVEQNLSKNYSTTTAMNAAIKASVDGLSTTVSKTYATTTQLNTAKNDAVSTAKSYTDSAKSSALTTAKGYADAAEDAANTNTENRLKSYSTTAQMNSAIKQKADEISTSVSATYATKTSVTTAQNNAVSTAKDYTDSAKASALTTAKGYADDAEAAANANTANRLKSYSTTAQMNSAINQKANEITASVSSTYATKSALNNANSEIDALQTWRSEASLKITDSAIVATVTSSSSWATKADKANLISQINQSAEQVAISASKIKLEGIITANGNFKILSDGSMETIAGKIGGWTISGNNLMDDRTDFLVRIAAPTVYGGDGNGNADVLVVRDKTNDTYPLVISSNGQVLATRCKFEGGTIGGWKINFTNLKSPSGNLTIDSATGTISTQRTNGNKGVAFYDDGIELYSWALDGNFIGRISTGNFSDTLVQAVTFYSDYGDMIIFGMQTQTKDKTNVQLALSDRETNGYKIGINAMKTIHAFGDIYSRSKLYIGSSNANPYFQLNSDGGIFVSTSKLYVAGIISGDAVYSAGRRTATCNNQIYFQWEPSMGKIAVFVDSTFIGYLSFQ